MKAGKIEGTAGGSGLGRVCDLINYFGYHKKRNNIMGIEGYAERVWGEHWETWR